MKGFHFTIIFTVIAYMIINMLAYDNRELQSVIYHKQRIEDAVNQAVDYAVDTMMINMSDGDIIDIGEVYHVFYESLSAALGCMDDSYQKELLHIYIPVMLITLEDGFYVIFNEEMEEHGEVSIKKAISEKIPFSYENHQAIYNFTFSDILTVYDKNNQGGINIQTVHYNELIEAELIESVATAEEFQILKSRVIVSKLIDYIQYYSNRNHIIAEKYHIYYEFGIPDFDNSDFIRTISNQGMIVLFQGYPYDNGRQFYNQFAVSGAVLKRIGRYCIEPFDYYLLYHSEECHMYSGRDEDVIVYGRENCAKEGAFPCGYCIR